MIITAKILRNGQRNTYPDLASAIEAVSKTTLLRYFWSARWDREAVDPTDKNQVHYFDQYDLRIPHAVVMRMIRNLPKPRWNRSTIQFGYKRPRSRWYRKPKTMNAKRQGVKGLPNAWDETPRASNSDRSWKKFRKVQYHAH